MAGPAPSAEDTVLIKDLLVFLFAAGVLVPLGKLARIPTVMGFVIAGILLGPSMLGRWAQDIGWLSYFTISEIETAAPFAELGVLFLLFLLGLELSFRKLWTLRKLVFGAGAIQSLASALIVGVVCLLIGMTGPAALVIGLALSLSSTAIVMQHLIDSKTATTPSGRAAFGVLLFQDILVAPILILVGFLGQDADGRVGELILTALIQGLIAIGVIFLVGRYLLRRVLRLGAMQGGRDFLFALCLLTLVGAAILTASAGLSLALGAFLAGLLLGETEFKHQAEIDLEPFKGLLLGLFFMTVGFGLDFDLILSSLPIVILGLIGLLAIKGLLVIASLWWLTGDRAIAIRAGLLLAPAGEFAFVILGAARSNGSLEAGTAGIVAAIAGLSMLVTPMMMPLAGWINSRLRTKLTDEPEADETLDRTLDCEGHVQVAGYGRVGQTVCQVLLRENAEIVAIDRNARRVLDNQRDDIKLVYGDASRPELLERLNAANASIFIVTVDDGTRAETMVRAMRGLRADITILARAADLDHAERLREAGADSVVPDAIEAGLQMAGRALEDFGYAKSALLDRLSMERDEAYLRSRTVLNPPAAAPGP
jgi:monovalent cation:H+ antiporter-2, CPA2 family